MKTKLLYIVFLSVTLISILGCKKTSEITCNLNTAESEPPVDMTVVYTATQTGDGTIASLSYTTISGTVTVANPTLPWTVTTSALTTTKVRITASGTVKNGSLKVSFAGGTGGITIAGSDYCEQQTK